jgi:hypothetical protein
MLHPALSVSAGFCPGASAGARLRALLSGFYSRKNAGSCARVFGDNFFCGECPPSRKGRWVLWGNFIIGGYFPIIAGNMAVCGSFLSFTVEAAAGLLAVRRLERVNAARGQSSGEVALLCVSRGLTALCVM